MATRVEELLAWALALPREAREEFAERLLHSVDPESSGGVAEAWDREIADRLRRFDAGETATVAWTDLRARLDAGR